MTKLYGYLILLIVFILMAVAIFFGGKMIIKLNDKIDSLETTVLQSDSTDKVVALDAKMFRRVLKDRLDTIEKRTGRKPKSITNVTENHIHYHQHDTTIYKAPEISSGVFDISTGDKCWGFNGSFNSNTEKVQITDKWYEDDITIFGYFLRDPLWGIKWLPKWGTRRDYLGSFSECGAKTEATEYKLEKGKK